MATQIAFGTLGIGTSAKVLSLGGGNKKVCKISNTFGEAIYIGTVSGTVVGTANGSANGFAIPYVADGWVTEVDNTNNIWAWGSANGTIRYWTERA